MPSHFNITLPKGAHIMSQHQNITRIGKEKFTFYTGPSSNGFAPITAGITYPDPSYKIYRCCSDVYVFEYLIDGKGYVSQDNRRFRVHPGDAYILHSGKEHDYYPDKKEPWTKIWFNVRGSLVRHLLADYELDNTLFIPGFHQPQYLYDILHTLEKDPVHSSQELAILLHRYIQALSTFCAALSDIPPQAAAMKNFIEQTLTQPLSIDEMADHVHLSRSRALHLFRDIYGISPYRYYMTQRLELAQSMLLHSTLSVQEVSDQLGFSDYRHFSGFFKKECGMSPMQYRAQQKMRGQ